MTQNDYNTFLESKRINTISTGFDIDIDNVNPLMFDFQKDITKWAIKKGKSAVFAGTGLGKTIIQLEWAKHIHKHENKPILILAPLAVSMQTVEEGKKFNIDVKLCRTQNDVINGINITNYEMLHHFDVSEFVGIVLDESSILKSFTGKVRTDIIEQFQYTQYKLACTATPSPNDYIELTNHSDFLGIMKGSEVLAMYFTHGSNGVGDWTLKGHAKQKFWEWMATWAVMLKDPIDLGYTDVDFTLPELKTHEIIVDKTGYRIKEAKTLNERRDARRNSIHDRVSCAAEIANSTDGCCLVWCNLNTESEMLVKAINESIEIKGAHSPEYKSEKMIEFSNGNIKCLVTKPSIAGHGLNWQHCNKMIFVGLSDSFEQYYQAVRRCWRFGQKSPVDVYIITSEKEGAVVKNIKQKEHKFKEMLNGMIAATQELTKNNIKQITRDEMKYETDVKHNDNWTIKLGDSCDLIKKVPTDSIDYTIFSPPFQQLFVYSNSFHDIGNCKNEDEFYNHMSFLSSELYRILKLGRLMAVHCTQIPTSKTKDGYIGMKDFRGDLIKIYQDAGFIYHSEICIWKDPVQEMYRTKSIGLLHRQLKKDSAMSRQGRADYLIIMRKPGDNIEPVSHTNEHIGVPSWQKLASPVWMDINQMDVLSAKCKDEGDEKHMCPLQLSVIYRCLELWTNPGDLIFDPFSGIGSTGYVAVKNGRQYLGFELKKSYFDQSVKNLKAAEYEAQKPKQIGMECFGE